MEGKIDLEKVPFARWLEEILPGLVQLEPEHIGIVAVTEDGTVGTSYWNCNSGDKGTMAWQILLDGVWDMISVNGDRLRAVMDEAEEPEEDEDAEE